MISACAREEEVTRIKVPKEDAPVASLPPQKKPAGLAWSVPKGWKSLPASGVRLATMTPPGPGKAELTITAFPGEVGGELANVNRWRGQLALPPIGESELAAARGRVASPAGPVATYELASADGKTRIAAGAISRGGTTWFVKLMGDAGAVAAAKPGFTSLLESLHAAR